MFFVCIRSILTNLCPLFASWNGTVPNINRALKSADLSSNKIGVDGIRALCDALETNNSLESLTIQNPYNGDTKIDAAGAQLIADMLAVNRALNFVDLRVNDILEEGKQQLRDAVSDKNITLQL